MFQEDFDDNFENTGVTAIALYDYQAAADDEISFDPNDIITNIEMVRVFIIFLVLCLGMFLHLCLLGLHSCFVSFRAIIF